MASTRITVCFFGMLLCVSLSKAATISFLGTFTQDDNVRLFSFTLNGPSDVTLKSYAYGGGTNGAAQTIAAGGFATDLSLFSGSGSLIDFTTSGSCPPQKTDPATGLCGDAVLVATDLQSGSYFVALTEFFNIPNGLKLSDGFLEDSKANFTGPNLCGIAGGFYDAGCNKRTGAFALDIAGVNAASAVPEPSFAVLTGLGLIAFGIKWRVRS